MSRGVFVLHQNKYTHSKNTPKNEKEQRSSRPLLFFYNTMFLNLMDFSIFHEIKKGSEKPDPNLMTLVRKGGCFYQEQT